MPRYFETITKKELKKKILDKYKRFILLDKCEYLEETKEDSIARIDKEPYNEDLKILEDINGGDWFNLFHKDFKVKVSFENHSVNGFEEFCDGRLVVLELSAAGDWEKFFQFYIYWDGEDVRCYIPTDGNPWNTDTKRAYGNDFEADKKNLIKRYPGYDSCEQFIDVFDIPDPDDNLIKKEIEKRILHREYHSAQKWQKENRKNQELTKQEHIDSVLNACHEQSKTNELFHLSKF